MTLSAVSLNVLRPVGDSVTNPGRLAIWSTTHIRTRVQLALHTGVGLLIPLKCGMATRLYCLNTSSVFWTISACEIGNVRSITCKVTPLFRSQMYLRVWPTAPYVVLSVNRCDQDPFRHIRCKKELLTCDDDVPFFPVYLADDVVDGMGSVRRNDHLVAVRANQASHSLAYFVELGDVRPPHVVVRARFDLVRQRSHRFDNGFGRRSI